MFGGGLQVLTDRDDIDIVPAQITHRLDHLVIRLTHADDDAALCQERGTLLIALAPQLLGAL